MSYSCDGQMSIFDYPEYLPDQMKNDYPCNGCIYDKHGCCGYNSKNDYCVLGDKRIDKAKGTSAILERELLRGSGFANGKKRIYEFFKTEQNEKKRQDFLKNEYGIGGWSIPEGILNHNANGIDIDLSRAPIGKIHALHSGWMMVERHINQLISEGKYYKEPSKCINCFHEDNGKCWCRNSGYYEQSIPDNPCSYLDLCNIQPCEHTHECNTYGIGCRGITYWCKRFD